MAEEEKVMAQEHEAEPGYMKLVNYRLDNIEKVLAELKDVVSDNKLQAKDIDTMNKNIQSNTDAINAHDKRIRALEVAPAKEKASKWESMIKTISELVLTACALIILAKIGLSA